MISAFLSLPWGIVQLPQLEATSHDWRCARRLRSRELSTDLKGGIFSETVASSPKIVGVYITRNTSTRKSEELNLTWNQSFELKLCSQNSVFKGKPAKQSSFLYAKSGCRFAWVVSQKCVWIAHLAWRLPHAVERIDEQIDVLGARK